jgi:hypothetical protein
MLDKPRVTVRGPISRPMTAPVAAAAATPVQRLPL